MISLDRRQAIMNDHRYQQPTSCSSGIPTTNSNSAASSSSTPNKSVQSSIFSDKISSQVLTECVDELVVGMCFQMHRAAKLGYLFLNEPDAKEEFKIVDGPDVDVFGNAKTAKLSLECACPKCGRQIVASRLAPHLEKCMGMGRNSSRIANKRIAKTSKSSSQQQQADSAFDSEPDLDGDGDSDWIETNSKPSKKSNAKKRKDKNGLTSNNKKSKSGISANMRQGRNGNSTFVANHNLTVTDIIGAASSSSSPANSDSGYISFETLINMDTGERESVFANQCAVISQTTKRACTKTLRCPQHSDEQRADIRRIFSRTRHKQAQLHSQSSSASSSSSGSAPNSVQSGHVIKSEPSSPYSTASVSQSQCSHLANTDNQNESTATTNTLATAPTTRSCSAPLTSNDQSTSPWRS